MAPATVGLAFLFFEGTLFVPAYYYEVREGNWPSSIYKGLLVWSEPSWAFEINFASKVGFLSYPSSIPLFPATCFLCLSFIFLGRSRGNELTEWWKGPATKDNKWRSSALVACRKTVFPNSSPRATTVKLLTFGEIRLNLSHISSRKRCERLPKPWWQSRWLHGERPCVLDQGNRTYETLLGRKPWNQKRHFLVAFNYLKKKTKEGVLVSNSHLMTAWGLTKDGGAAMAIFFANKEVLFFKAQHRFWWEVMGVQESLVQLVPRMVNNQSGIPALMPSIHGTL